MAAGKRLVRELAASASLGFGAFTGALPLPVSRALGRGLARIAYYAVPRVRRVGMGNLDLAYGDALAPAEKKRILRGAVENVGVVAGEFMHLPRLVRAGAMNDHVTCTGLEHFDRSRGALVIAGHLGNWEWMAPALAAQGLQVAGIVRPLDVPRLNAWVDATRRAGNITTIPKDHAAAEMVKLLQSGFIGGLLIDQSPREKAVRTTFFGQPCWSTIGAAAIAQRAQVPVHMVKVVRQGDGRYELHVGGPLDLVNTGDRRGDIAVNTQRIQDTFEAIVREHPEQWLWLHRRWKARPQLEQAAAEGEKETGQSPTQG